MFAIPENTVLHPLQPHPLSPTALVRWASSTQWSDLLREAAPTLPLPYNDPRVRIWLTVLSPGDAFPRSQRYDASQGAFAVLNGVVVEETGDTARTLRPGQARVFGPGYRHTVRNAGAEPAVAVHVQINPQPIEGAA